MGQPLARRATLTEAPVNETVGVSYGGGPGDVTGFYLRCQGELLGLCGTIKIVIPVENYPQKLMVCHISSSKWSNVYSDNR